MVEPLATVTGEQPSSDWMRGSYGIDLDCSFVRPHVEPARPGPFAHLSNRGMFLDTMS